MIIDENASPYLDANTQRFAGAPRAVSKKDGEFKESNKKHTIKGRSTAISTASLCVAESASAGI